MASSSGENVQSPYTGEDLEHFRNLLLDRRDRILHSVKAMESEALKEAGQNASVDHMADHGSDNYEQDLTLSLMEGERKELAEIDGALVRVQDGVYGVCEGTGEAINRERLEAIPYTRYSIEYQRKVEAGEDLEDVRDVEENE